MELIEKLLNHWIKYEGGVHPNSNLFQFVVVDDHIVRFELHYVFDSSEDDTVSLGINLPHELFTKMVDDLENNGHAILETENNISSLSSEWRFNNGELEIRMTFSGVTLSGPVKYYMPEYKKALIQI